ncbi:AgmX/PglI C-terminal domain-containing protein [Nannocystaceae bacterium ST9]
MASKTLTFRIFLHDQLVDTRAFTQDVIKIGRLASSHLRLDDDAVGRMHAVIEVGPSDVRLIDLGSNQGTWLNERAIDRNHELRSGDCLKFGPFRIELAIADALPNVSVASMIAPQIAAAPAKSAPAVTSVDLGKVEDSSKQVAEVVAMYGRAVVDVAHVGQTQARKRSAMPLLALGGLLFAGGLGLFGYEVAQPWQEYSKVRVEAQQAHAVVPEAPGLGTGGLGLGLALLGLIPFMAGALRMREDVLDVYTIGESPAASFKVAGHDLPDAGATPLVERSAGGYALAFTPSMTGTVDFDGQQFALADLVATGRAIAREGMYRYELPTGARAKLQHGDVGFQVSLVNRGAIVAGRGEVDWPFWAYAGGTGAIGLGFYLLMRATPADAMALELADDEASARYARYIHQADEVDEVEPEQVEQVASEDTAGGTPGKRAGGAEGLAGKPTSRNTNGAYKVAGNSKSIPMIGRNFDPSMQARNAGILGVLAQQDGHFFAAASGGAFTVGQDDADIWGNITGTDYAEAYGVGGMGLVGSGRGGGGADGLIGMGNTGLLGHGPGSGGGPSYGPGDGKLVGFSKKKSPVPAVHVGQAEGSGIDRDMVRRIVRAHINEVRSCYNAGLTKNPNLEGRVLIKFTIIPNGKVSSAMVEENTTKESSVGDCIAKAVKRWSFPKASKGTAIVTYPFRLSNG